MKIQGWFHPLRSGSFSAEIQQKRKHFSGEKQLVKLNFSKVSAEIQRKRNHSSEGKIKLPLLILFQKIKFQKNNQEGKNIFHKMKIQGWFHPLRSGSFSAEF